VEYIYVLMASNSPINVDITTEDDEIICQDGSDEETTPLYPSDEESEFVPLPPSSPSDQWSTIYPSPGDRTFVGGVHGVTFPVPDAKKNNPLWWFRQFWTDQMSFLVVAQTNLYRSQWEAEKLMATGKIGGRDWTNLIKEELDGFLSILIVLGLNHTPAPDKVWSLDSIFQNKFVYDCCISQVFFLFFSLFFSFFLFFSLFFSFFLFFFFFLSLFFLFFFELL
jgi:hypothetical protein